MGRTTPTITQLIHHFEGTVFRPFSKVASLRERHIIRDLFARARNHIAPISMAGHLLPFETTLLAMLLEQYKQIKAIEAQKDKRQE